MISRKEADKIERQLQKIRSETHFTGQNRFNTHYCEEFKLHFIIDEKMAPARFLPDPTKKNTWVCSSQTYRALRKEIFSAGEEFFSELETRPCENCSKLLDTDFWWHCPHCGKEI